MVELEWHVYVGVRCNVLGAHRILDRLYQHRVRWEAKLHYTIVRVCLLKRLSMPGIS
jgi:hypothetical protein